MHGYSLAFDIPVNTEVDSMQGVVEVDDGVGTRPFLRRGTAEKVQADLRQKYDFRKEKKRELDFLEKGGDPLEFMFGNADSTSVQSTTLTAQAPELFVTSEASGSIAFTASSHGDSVESSGTPGKQSACEPISADNLLLFDGNTDSIDGDRISKRPKKSRSDLADLSFNLNGSEHAKDTGDSGSAGLAKIAYNRRRYKSQPDRHSACSSSSDMVLAQGINESSLHSFDGQGGFEGLVSDRGQDPKVSSNSYLDSANPISFAGRQTAPSNNQMDMRFEIVKVVESTNDLSKDDPANDVKDSGAMQNSHDNPHNVDPLCGVHKYPRTQIMEESYAFRASEELAVESLECRPDVPVAVIETHDRVNVDVKIASNGSVTSNIGLVSNILESVSSCNQTRHSLDGSNDTVVQANGRGLDASGVVTYFASVLGSHEAVRDHLSKERDGPRANENEKLVIDEGYLFKESLEEKGFLLKSGEGANSIVSGFENEVEKQGQKKMKYLSMVESRDMDSCGKSEAGRVTDVTSGVNEGAKDENFCKVGPEASSGPSIEKLPKTEPPAGISDSVVAPNLSVSDLKETKADEDLILEEARIIEAKRKRIAQLSLPIASVDFHGKSQWDFVLQEMAWLANDFAQERLWKISAASHVACSVSLLSRFRFHEKNSIMESRKNAQFLARSVMEFWHSLESKSQGMELLFCNRNHSPVLREYALRFRKNYSLEAQNVQVQAPLTPDRASDVAITHISLGDCSQEDTIFYAFPPGALQRYIKSLQSCTTNYEKTCSSIPEEFETSTSNAVTDNVNDVDVGETSTYDIHVASGLSKSLNCSQKKLKNGAINLEVVADSPFMQRVDKKVSSQQPFLMGKRIADSLNVSFRTKRVRSSNRQRALCSFTGGISAYVEGQTNVDASSGDTNSFLDDQSTVDVVSPASNNIERESVRDFGKKLGYESAEVSTQMKRKKGFAYEQKWLVDCNFLSDQRDHSKKRSDSHHHESNGSSDLFGHHAEKKLKVIRQSCDIAVDSSAPSPMASQISNPKNLINSFSRDRVKKTKLLKIPANESGSGSNWSQFEEQALLVLVHDLGPNWSLVSDAVNSILKLKCIFRNPKECKEHHKQLMDMNSGDGADSVEDSGSSQPYTSTLRGIPTGSARQLFQQLQGPLEEYTVKSHFEIIIKIGQKLRCRRKQEPKQMQPPHGSHMVALTQVSPNNLVGFPILTPLDLCDATGSGLDILPVSNSVNSPVLASGNTATGNNFSSSPVPAKSSFFRDSRCAISKSTSLTNLPSPRSLPDNDRGVHRLLPGGIGVTAINSGGNRSIPIGRTASPMVNGANMISSNMVAMPSLANIHGGGGSVWGNPARPSHEPLHMIRPTQNQDPQSQELQRQVTQGSNRVISPYGAINSSFSNQTPSPSVSSKPIHHQHPHTMSSREFHSISPHHPHVQGNNQTSNLQHHAYAINLAKDRHMLQQEQHCLQLQQQQHQFPQSSPPPTVPRHEQQHQMRPHGFVPSVQTVNSSMTNQTAKQRRRQAPKQRQQIESQQQGSNPKNPASVGKTLVRESLNQSQPVQRLLSGQVSPASLTNADPHSQLSGYLKSLNQSQLSAERMLQQNHHLNSNSTKLQEREPQKDDQILIDNVPNTEGERRFSEVHDVGVGVGTLQWRQQQKKSATHLQRPPRVFRQLQSVIPLSVSQPHESMIE